ncbi:MAG TPA: C25 family cysteine peptidase [Thermoanaerobaculia bacterium]|nr:C25 family cysteine peptidase [Thermoanaerobaculia bacterium]
MSDKVVVTNRSALKAKYGDLATIDDAVNQLVAADKARGVETIVIALDDAATMQKYNAPVVTDATSAKQNKDAIDAIDKATNAPDYLVILGGPDVIPHQDLKNPMASAADRDEFAWGDLPYACEAPYSQNVQDFTGPTRILGRIPDMPGANDPAFLIGVLKTATEWKANPVASYANVFGLSTFEWQASTKQSVQNVFGATAALSLSPSQGPAWDDPTLSARAHFINCHGALNDSKFYGQAGSFFPPSHKSEVLAGKRFDGTIVSAECCYGGQLFLPKTPTGWGICTRYLEGGAYAYFGSTTIAYGPKKGNGQADVLCQLFLKKAISGASTGRSALEARQEFISALSEMSPADLKTIAQFNLYGDPSIHPAIAPAAQAEAEAAAAPAAQPGVEAKGLPMGFGFEGFENPFEKIAKLIPKPFERAERRHALTLKGLQLAANKAVAKFETIHAKLDDALKGELDKLTADLDIDADDIKSFVVERTGQAQQAAERFSARAFGPAAATNMHLIVGRRKSADQTDAPFLPHIVAIIAKEAGGKVLSYVELHSK